MLKFNEFHGKLCSFIDNIFCILINYNSYQLYITNFLNLQFRFYQSFFASVQLLKARDNIIFYVQQVINNIFIYLKGSQCKKKKI